MAKLACVIETARGARLPWFAHWRADRDRGASDGQVVESPATRRRQLLFAHPLPTDAALRPEQRLMIAILEDAVRTVLRGASAADRPARRMVAETRGWFAADDPDWPFSFINVCDALHLDAGSVRAWLAGAQNR